MLKTIYNYKSRNARVNKFTDNRTICISSKFFMDPQKLLDPSHVPLEPLAQVLSTGPGLKIIVHEHE